MAIDTSGIDITKPAEGEATTQSVRDNTSAIKTELDKISSTANGEGASVVYVEDSAANFTATDVESVLAEIQTDVNTRVLSSDLASVANGKGASLIGVEDSAGDWTATTQEALNTEIADKLDGTLPIAPDINGGTIDGVAIGAETPSTGDFTTLTATTGTISDNLKTQRTVINFASDANYTLSAAQNNYSQVEMADTGVILTTAKDVLFDATPRLFSFINSTAQILTPKVSGGAGPAIPADGRLYNLYSDGTDIVISPSELQLGTPIATTSGTSHDFTIPSWAKKVTITTSGVTRGGTSPIIFQIGDSGGIETTSYIGSATSISSAAQGVQNNSTGFHIGGDASVVNTAVFTGTAILSIHDESANEWNLAYAGGRSDTANAQYSSGSKGLSGKLTTVRLTTVGGTDTFTAGSFNVMYE